MKILFVLAVVLAVATAYEQNEAKRKFIAFQQKYNKVYSAEEFQNRFQIFAENLDKAAELSKKNPHARFGPNEFSDLSSEEFRSIYLMTKFDAQKAASMRPPYKIEFGPAVGQGNGSTFDWNSKGVVTGVYNQGQCGSCWAFSATETIESYFALAGGALTGLSMQQIVSCDTSDHGCEGGFPSEAYNYVQSAGGIDSLANYPYTSESGYTGECSFPQGQVVTNVAGQQSIGGETGLYQQLQSGGPVSVCVDASSWQSYEGGVLTSCGNQVDHCVQATGFTNYGAGWGTSAWNVRNSWGTGWGESGYIYVATGEDLCSIGDYATVVST